jgi:hypothetical protein
MFNAVLLMFILLYKIVAIPAGMLFAFFVARSLLRHRSAPAAMGITLAWTLAIFTPLLTPAHSFFDDIYAPWYLALMATPPTPQVSAGALALTVVLCLASSGVAAGFAKRRR